MARRVADRLATRGRGAAQAGRPRLALDYEKARIKMLYYLNSDPEYYKKLKPATEQKYNFKKEGDRWI